MLFIALGEDFPNIEYHRVKHTAAYLGMKNLCSKTPLSSLSVNYISSYK